MALMNAQALDPTKKLNLQDILGIPKYPTSAYQGIFEPIRPGGGPSGMLRKEFQWKPSDVPSLLPGLEKRLGDIQTDPRAMQQMREEALRRGPSAWAGMQLERQRGLRSREKSDLATRLGSAMAEQRSAQAMRGGMGAGARERLGVAGLREMMRQKADLSAKGREEDLGIMSEDEKRRLGLLQQLPGMELAQLGPQFQKLGAWQQMAGAERGEEQAAKRFNIEAALRMKAAKESSQMKKYEEQMKALGAERTAQAQEEAGKK